MEGTEIGKFSLYKENVFSLRKKISYWNNSSSTEVFCLFVFLNHIGFSLCSSNNLFFFRSVILFRKISNFKVQGLL